jgi:hypothetical protein
VEKDAERIDLSTNRSQKEERSSEYRVVKPTAAGDTAVST